MRRKFSLLVLVCALNWGCGAEAPDLTTSTIQNVGLVQTSSTPPLGVGIAPLDGTGGDGSPSVPGKGIAEGGPGAVRWYGGQWLIPYQGTPGSVVQNVSCDVIPNNSSTDLIELVGSAGVIGSVMVPATTGVTIRAWITPTTTGAHLPYTLGDGEVLVMRHSPRDVATGGWTSGVQQLTVVGCAVNSTAKTAIVAATINIPVTPGPGRADGPSLGFTSTNWGVNTSTNNDGALFPVRGVPAGATITAVRVKLSDSTSAPATVELLAKEMPGLTAPAWVSKGSATSAGSGAIQLIQFSPGYLVPSSAEMILVAHGISVSPLRVYVAELDYQ